MREIRFTVETKFGPYSDMIVCGDETTEYEVEKLKLDSINQYVDWVTTMSEISEEI